MASKEFQQKVRDHLLAKKAKLPACPLCKNPDWGASDPVGMIAAPAGPGQPLHGASFVPIVCTHCGYTILMHAFG